MNPAAAAEFGLMLPIPKHTKLEWKMPNDRHCWSRGQQTMSRLQLQRQAVGCVSIWP
jgi:hypothetical protein